MCDIKSKIVRECIGLPYCLSIAYCISKQLLLFAFEK